MKVPCVWSGHFSITVAICHFSVAVLFLVVASATAQVAHRNVNMVSGTSYPGGDPFLRQQNEGTAASLTRNPCHLLGGANDYRSVDIPFPSGLEEVTGDAWLGVFKSFDCGQRWQSTLLPGYPQDFSPEGLASPLKGFKAGADPVVIASHNGLAYYIGLVFDRDQDKSAVFAARFIDLNNKEGAFFDIESNADPIKYIDAALVTNVGNPGQFLDRPWAAADIPRAGAEVVSLEVPLGNSDTVTQTFACGNVYVSYAAFLGNGPIHTKLYVATSSDCGGTWSKTKVSDGHRVNNGTTLAIDPNTGDVYVAWRRFAANQPDAILISKSTDGGAEFSEAEVVHTLNPPPFEQGTTSISFRTTATPSMAVGSNGRVYLSWSEEVGPAGEGRIVLTSSDDGGETWSAPTPVDNPPLRLGHQFFPALLFHQGQLAVLYYGQDLDHTRGILECQLADPNQCVDTTDLTEIRQPRGHLDHPFEPERVFNQCIAEVGFNDPNCNLDAGFDPLLRRHTVDVYLAMTSDLDPVPVFGPPIRVSQYLFGQRDPFADPLAENPPVIEQFEFNPPNLPMFLAGTVPFFSDYIFLAGAPPMLANPNGTWSFNDEPGSPAVLHAIWTENRNVRPPPPGLTWADYVPPTSPEFPAGRPSVFDPSQMVPNCDPSDPLAVFRTGMRNQDIYTAKITEGLLTGSLQTNKPLGMAPHPDPDIGGEIVIQRALVVFVQNATAEIRHYRLSIVGAPPGGTASFDQFDPTLMGLGVSIAPLSTISRMVFVTSPDDPAARVTVDVTEIADPTDLLSVVPDGLHGEVVFNADPSAPDIGNPDIGTPDIGNIANSEVYNPDIGTPDIGTPDIGTPDIGTPDIGNPDIGTPDIGTPDIGNPDIGTPDIGTPDIGTPDIGNPDIGTPDIGTGDLSDGSYVDATWTMTNIGNTSAAYDVDLFRTSAVPGGVQTQMILHKIYTTPTSAGCELVEKTHNVLVANITDPQFITDPGDIGQIDPTNPDIGNATISLAPEEAGKITLRFLVPNDLLAPGETASDFVEEMIVDNIAPVTVSQGVNTVEALAGETDPPFAIPLTILTGSLPLGTVGVPYSEILIVDGGVAPYTWSVIVGSLPAGLSLGSGTGVISGIPTGAGFSSFTVQVQDSSVTPATDTQDLTLQVDSTAAKTVFVTSQQFTPAFGGVAGADAQCQSSASNAELSGSYKAWLSDSSTDAADRLSQSPGPYRLVDGTLVASSFADLINCPPPFTCTNVLQNPIDQDEFGNQVTGALGARGAWTGTFPDGTKDAGLGFCSDWTSTGAGGARSGDSARTDFGWTACCSTTCNFIGRLYCFEETEGFTNSQDYLEAIGVSVLTETYEQIALDTVIPDMTTVNGLHYDFPTGAEGLIGDTFDRLDSQSLEAWRGGEDSFFFPGEAIDITFAMPVSAVGVFFNVASSTSLTDYCFISTPRGSVSTGGETPDTSMLFFAGMVSDVPFNTARIACTADAPSGFNLDNLSRLPFVGLAIANDDFQSVGQKSQVCRQTSPTTFDCSDVDGDPDRHLGVVAADFDGLNGLDLVFSEFGGPNEVCLDDGAGGFNCSDINTENLESFDVKSADFDGVNGPDVVFSNLNQPNQLCLNDGSGGFDCSNVSSDSNTSRGVAVADFDGVNGLDIAFANIAFVGPAQSNRICLNDGANTFTCANVSGDTNPSRGVATDDFDGANGPDLVFANDGVENFLCLNSGAGTFACSSVSGDTNVSIGVDTGDLDGINGPDMVFGNSNGANRVCFNSGAASFVCSDVSADSNLSGRPTVVDVDGLNGPDIVIPNFFAVNRLCMNDGSGTFSCSDLSPDVNNSRWIEPIGFVEPPGPVVE